MELWRITCLLAASLLFVSSVSAADYSSSYWLEKPAWNDRPLYAQNMQISITPTDLIENREYREVCTGYSNTTYNNGTTVETCDSYENESYPGSNAGVFDVTGRDAVYLGDGYVRANVTVGLNELSRKTLKEAAFLISESDYIDWFNQNYFYKDGNMTASDLSKLQSKVQDLSPQGENTGIVASEVNSIDLASQTADLTVVFRFKDFRSGVLTVSDLLRVEVVS